MVKKQLLEADGTLRILDLDTSSFQTLDGQISNFLTIAVTPDGKKAVTGSDDRTVGI
jgi:WD40 repeat protein